MQEYVARSFDSAMVRGRLFRPVRVDPSGRSGPTRSQMAGVGWQRTSRGFYVPWWVQRSAAQRILEASVLVPPAGAITGWAALAWMGARWFTGETADGSPLPVDILISSHDIRPQAGIALSGEGCGPGRKVLVDGVRVTDPIWTVAFLMRRAPNLRRAVQAFDLAAYDDLVSLDEVTAEIAHQNSWTGVPQAREALGLVSENCWSPKECDMRLNWVAAGMPMPEANVPLFDLEGRRIGTPDLLDRRSGVVGEYHGSDHWGRDARRVDLAREERFRAAGLEVVTSTAGDTLDVFLPRLTGAYERADASVRPRRWTADPPDWWTSTTTVARRRALPEARRERLLRYRAG